MSSNRNSSGGCGWGVILLILAVYAMPLVGLYLGVSGESDGEKGLGWVLFIVGILVYAKLGIT